MIPPLGTRVTPDWLEKEPPHHLMAAAEPLIGNTEPLPLRGSTITRPNALFAKKPPAPSGAEEPVEQSLFDDSIFTYFGLLFGAALSILATGVFIYIRNEVRNKRAASTVANDEPKAGPKETPVAAQKPPQAPALVSPRDAKSIKELLNQPLANGKPLARPFDLPDFSLGIGVPGFIPQDYEDLESARYLSSFKGGNINTISTDHGDVKTTISEGGNSFHPRNIILYEFPTPEFLARDIDGSIITAGEGFLKANAFLVITQVFDMDGQPVEKLAAKNADSPHYVEREIRFHYDGVGELTAVTVRDQEFSLARNSVIIHADKGKIGGYTGRLLAQFTPENMPAPDVEKFEKAQKEAAEHLEGLLSSLRDSLARYASQTGDQKEQAKAVILENAKLAMHTLGAAMELPISEPDRSTGELLITARDEKEEKEARDPRVILEFTQEKAGLLSVLGEMFEFLGDPVQSDKTYNLLADLITRKDIVSGTTTAGDVDKIASECMMEALTSTQNDSPASDRLKEWHERLGRIESRIKEAREARRRK